MSKEPNLYQKAVDRRIRRLKRKFKLAKKQKSKTIKYSKHSTKIRKEVEMQSYRWCMRNKWFGTEADKTNYAFLIHSKLVDEFDISVNTKGYYKLVDAFMSYYDEVNRVKLTLMQIKLAKRLGIKNPEKEHYAQS
jgi:hypothetical protein